jgi:hypothetical protein
MNENNGFWINNKSQTVDFIADILQNWLEDNLKPELFSEMEKTVQSLPTKEEFESNAISLFEGYLTTRQQSFEEQLNKLVETETIQ